MTNSKRNNAFLKIRDVSIIFRDKGKKLKAVKETTIDIQKGEIFGLVGESGSGKTTLARGVVGVQSLSDGTIYMEDVIVAGKSSSLHKLNSSISLKLNSFERKIFSVTKFLKALVVDLKKELQKNKQTQTIIKEKLIKDLQVDKIRFISDMYKYCLIIINEVIVKQERIMRFVNNISNQVKEIPLELEQSIIKKQKQVNLLISELKSILESIYLSTNKLLNDSKKDLQKTYKVSDIFKKLFIELDDVVTKNNDLLEKIDFVKSIQKENTLLTAPEKIKNNQLPKYYKKVYVSRKWFLEECKNQLIKISNSSDQNSVKEKKLLEEYLRDFWSKSNIKINECFKILKEFKNETINWNKLEALANKLLNTDFENDLKNKVFTKKNLTENEINNLFKEAMYIKKIIIKDVVKDEEMVQKFYTWKNLSIEIVEDEQKNIKQFIEFLELPSIDKLVKKSYINKQSSYQTKKENRRNIQMIFQDPSSSLNDRMSVEEIIGEGLINYPDLYKSDEAKKEYMDYYNSNNQNKIDNIKDVKAKDVKKYLILKVLNSVGLLPEHLSRYPHEFSGGQRQRIGIARSLILKPKVIIADEPISALDVSIRAQVLNLFKKFQKELEITFIFVAHDLSVVRFITDRIAVIYHGQIVELAEADELFKNPIHPYTKSLLSAIPQPEPSLARETISFVYDPEKEHHDYIFDLPRFIELSKDHFVYLNNREAKEYQSKIKKIK
ncbi:oligopeptide ABC transporter ATP-binding protein [Spiroplasma gladiatoris]|uniref:Oligopeptide ABC transporter ATP-binding protein n=1 Tax=Spiroplasma gladiatoris TaxID=2143 RepID=A0A4P7AI67_9MOLU|nr:oligopeptide ABC transporter ATP-binding protein OppF [Spiroplasma gladiatoris]QBQ07942.1 oligopeptide ABC transporter ATP-binding protein [Spiroplasma gladiatoris]